MLGRPQVGLEDVEGAIRTSSVGNNVTHDASTDEQISSLRRFEQLHPWEADYLLLQLMPTTRADTETPHRHEEVRLQVD